MLIRDRFVVGNEAWAKVAALLPGKALDRKLAATPISTITARKPATLPCRLISAQAVPEERPSSRAIMRMLQPSRRRNWMTVRSTNVSRNL